MKLESSLARLFILLWRLVSNRWTRWVAAWLVCLGLATHLQHKAIHSFDTRASQPTEQRPAMATRAMSPSTSAGSGSWGAC